MARDSSFWKRGWKKKAPADAGAVGRAGIKRNPFHPFSTFDTVTLAGMAYGQTVLSRAVMAAGFDWDNDRAHSAIYDTERTADLFCNIMNRWNEIMQREALPAARSPSQKA